MCGRTSLAVDISVLRQRFDVATTDAVEAYVPKYNIDPSDGLVTITNENPDTADVLEWGFVPEWADDPDDVPNPINARAEGVQDSGMFRSALKNKRCLVIADGFYEWQGARGRKQPYRIVREDREPFAFAGLWSQWEPASGNSLRETVTILTTEPNAVLEPIHDRMPVMLEPTEETAWLTGDTTDAMGVLDTYPEDVLEAYPVSKQVNNPDTETPDLYEQIDIGEQSGLDEFSASD
ncbi:SOS response-associated peptidase [Halobacterium wangiae]|uniref:SOS response-associated peptidase n=1 Tax=Halobacterium wangiae TaxID=2902623 RepID=UPI001E30F6BA|nr:SOS response-associated peptidase [Halobacterium wangiae]